MRFPRECVFQPRLYQRLKLQPARIEHPSGRCRGNPEKIRNGMPTITLSKTDVAGPLWPSFCCSCCHCWTASRQAQHVSGAARLAGRLFAERPKAFRRPIKWFVASAPPAASLATDQFSGCGRTDADPRCFPPLIHLKTLPLLWSDVFYHG